MAVGTATIYLTDSQRKVQGGFALNRDSLFDSLVLGVFLTTFLLGLGVDRLP